MAWQIRFGGDKVVNLDDLSPDIFDALAVEDASNTSWYSVYASPGASAGRFYRVVCAAADFADLDPPERPTTMREAKLLLDMLEEADDIADAPVLGEFPPTPSETESGSSSGRPDDSDGSPPISDASQ